MAEPKTAPAVTKEASSKGGGRGVSYPSISLEEAVTRAQQFWSHEKKNAAPISAAAEHWGYTAKSSATRLVAAALLHYGLMEDSGSNEARTIRLTDRALNILLDEPNSPSRLRALQEAARAPKINTEILSRWKPNELPSDQTLRFYLLRERDFNEGAVDGFIKDFRATVTFAKLGDPDNIPADSGDKSKRGQIKPGDYVQWESAGVMQFAELKKVTGFSEDGQFAFVEGSETGLPVSELTVHQQPAVQPAPAAVPPVRPVMPGNKQDIFSLDEGQVVLQWPSKMSKDSYEDFKAWIDLQVKKIGRAVS